MLGHELRNPLGALAGAVRVLEVHSELDVKLRNIMLRQSSHLARLVDDLLDVGRLTAGMITLDRHPLDLAQVARECIATLTLNNHNDGPRIFLQAEPAWINGDVNRVEQIFINLVSNALKHMRKHGKIRVVVAAMAARAIIRIEDDGDGISADLLPHIFALFVQAEQQAHRPSGGLGIGLTVVRRLVELH